MFIVPFIIRDALPSMLQWNMRPITLFMENRGKTLCTTDASPKEWLAINGIVSENEWEENGIYYAKVDVSKTQMSDFYSFEQLTKEPGKGTEECWRTFFLFKEISWDKLFDTPAKEVLATIQKKLML